MTAWTTEHRRHVGELIALELERRSIDNSQAAHRYGVSIQTIYRAKQGTVRPAKLMEIARDLGIPEVELVPPPPAEQQTQLDRIEAQLAELLSLLREDRDEKADESPGDAAEAAAARIEARRSGRAQAPRSTPRSGRAAR